MKIEIKPFLYREVPIATFDWLLSNGEIFPRSYYVMDEVIQTKWQLKSCYKTYEQWKENMK